MSAYITLDTGYLKDFVSDKDIKDIMPEVMNACSLLKDKSGPGNDFLGWQDLPVNYEDADLSDMEQTASGLREISDAVIVIGIGGSYLGAKSTIDMLTPVLGRKKVFFAGCDLNAQYLKELAAFSENKDISIIVISKSGTTTEPAVAFRIFLDIAESKYDEEELKKRVVCITDSKKGALRELADARGFKSYIIPDDVGGRFSVLTPVGLLPAACEGVDIRGLLAGALAVRNEADGGDPDKNIIYRYAALRNILYRKGKVIEIFSNFDRRFHYLSEWCKQLFGESEGKDGKGIFPASCDFSTDLHSMGQLIQQGNRNIFETFIIEQKESAGCRIPHNENDLDNLNYLSGREVSFVNKQAYLATSEAHFEGGVPNLTVFIPEISAFYLGQLFYFFEKAVAVSAYILGVNPFNQPGVESYKKKMFKLLGKPGS